MLKVYETQEGVTFAAKVAPGSSVSRIARLWEEAVKVTIAAAAERGKANKELIRLLSKLLRCPKSAITIVSGEGQPRKQVHIAGLSRSDLMDQLKAYLV